MWVEHGWAAPEGAAWPPWFGAGSEPALTVLGHVPPDCRQQLLPCVFALMLLVAEPSARHLLSTFPCLLGRGCLGPFAGGGPTFLSDGVKALWSSGA